LSRWHLGGRLVILTSPEIQRREYHLRCRFSVKQLMKTGNLLSDFSDLKLDQLIDRGAPPWIRRNAEKSIPIP
jgi:hypothetical protein